MRIFPRYILLLISCIVLSACSSDNDSSSRNETKTPESLSSSAPVLKKGCRSCHDVQLDERHNFECSRCHNGDDQAVNKVQAHKGITISPAAPDTVGKYCSPCHKNIDETLASSHFTSRNMVNLVRRHFGATQDIASADNIPIKENPETALDLADDLLRRNCLTCHLTYRGDDYSSTRRGIGCAACHLEYQNGSLASHRFIKKPADQICLSCHYGNRVGSDYYGMFEHDFKHEYRTPYQPDGSYPARPYGVEQHQLVPDIHKKAGVTCIDCHPGEQLMGNTKSISCEDCHFWQERKKLPGRNFKEVDGSLVLFTALDNRKLVVPSAYDDLHREVLAKADCQVCHAQWSYTDQKTHLLRLDVDDYEEWDDLIVQSNYEVEVLLSNSLYGEDSYAPSMTDKITGLRKDGLWLKGYDIRRWEEPPVRKDDAGKLRIVRPVLDLVLSWVNSENETVFDSLMGEGREYFPYTPHTTGPAGSFYRIRLKEKIMTEPPETPSDK